MVSRRLNAHRKVDLVYLDAGIYSGLEGEIKYRTLVEKQDGTVPEETSTVLVAGPSCDSTDVLHETYELPVLEPKDRVYFLAAGAYLAARSAVGFQRFSTSQDLRVG